eukprot:s1188_g1.t3
MRQLELVQKTFFSYIVQNWFEDLDCMERAVREMNPNLWRGKSDLRWALSVVKTRGFAFEGTRESTMLIPLADFLNHNMVASVRTATLAEDDALRFVATKDVMPGDELCIDYAQASNLEFLVRYGFRIPTDSHSTVGKWFVAGHPRSFTLHVMATGDQELANADSPSVRAKAPGDEETDAWKESPTFRELGIGQLSQLVNTEQSYRLQREPLQRQVPRQVAVPVPTDHWQRGAAAFGAALAVRASRASRTSLTRRAASSKSEGRQISIENEFTFPRELPRGSVESMDEFMRANAAQVCLQGLQRVEEKHNDPEVLLCYLEPTDMGPYRTQMLMEVKITVSSGKCDIYILDMSTGSVDKKTGEVTFDPANKVDQKADNCVTWKDNGNGGLDLVNYSWSQSTVGLPWWFPLPDSFMQKTAQFVIGQVVKDGMKKANDKIAASYAEELERVKCLHRIVHFLPSRDTQRATAALPRNLAELQSGAEAKDFSIFGFLAWFSLATASTMEPGVSQYISTGSSWLPGDPGEDAEPRAPADSISRTRPGTTLSISDTPRTSSSPPSRAPEESRTPPPRMQQGGLPLVDEGFSQDGVSPCCSAVSDTTSLAAELMSKDITQSLQSVAYVSMALERHADEDCSQTSQAVSLRIGQKLTAEIGNTFLAQFQSDAAASAASAARSADGTAAPEAQAEAEPIAGMVEESAKSAVPSEAAHHAAEPSEVASEGNTVTKEIVPIVASPEETSGVRTPSLELGHQLATEMLLMACSSAVSLPSTARSVATSDQVFPKAEIDEVNMLTRAIAADAIADDASAHTVDVLTDISDQPGQLTSQPTAAREASARQRPADLEVAEGNAVKAPRTIRRDSTLTIPSPTARDAEVMHSNEVQLEDDVAVDDLAATDSVPFGIMITDAETRKSIVLLEPPILESKLQTTRFKRLWLTKDPPPARKENECETESEENVEAPGILPDLKDTVEEAIWSAVLEEVQRDAETYKEASLVTSEGHAVEPNSLEVPPTRLPSRSPTEVTILPVAETAKTMDELLDEINVLQASLTYSDELPADPEMEADNNSTQHVLGVSLSQPFSDLISSGPQASERDMAVVKEYAVPQGLDRTPTSLPEASPQDAFEQTLAEALIDAAVIKECILHGEQAKLESSEVLSAGEAADNASDAPTVSPEIAQDEENERAEEQLALHMSLKEALQEKASEATLLDEFGENLAKELLHVAVLLDAESNEANRVSSEVLSASEAASEAPTVSPEVAREDEERMDHERMLQSSLKEALREADSGKPQAASTYISNCSMPEAQASESVGLKVAQELLDSALEHEQKEQAKRNSSEVLSAMQVEALETADGPTRPASEAATVSPEVAREDEERMDQERLRLLQSSLKEALVDADSKAKEATAMAKFGDALAEELLDAAMEEIKRKQEAQAQVPAARLATPSIISERSSCEAAVVEAFGLKLAQDLLDEASFLQKQEIEASQVITEDEVSRPPSEVTIVPGLAQKTKGELMDEIDILASSLTLANQREQEVADRPSSSQSDRDPSRISVLTTGSTAAMEELVHSLVVNSLPEKTDVQQAASNVHTEGSELMAPTVQPVEVAIRPASAGVASSVSASEEGSYGLQIAQDAVHTACEAISALKSDAVAGKEAEPCEGAQSAEDALIAHAAED